MQGAPTAGFKWYKDLALGVCVFLLFIVGLGTLLEAFTGELTNRTRFLFGLTTLAVAAGSTFFATSRRAVLAFAAAIVGSRGLIAVALQPRPAKYVGLVAAIFSAAILWLVIRSQDESRTPYDPDKSKLVWNLLAVVAGVGIAMLLMRGLSFSLLSNNRL